MRRLRCEEPRQLEVACHPLFYAKAKVLFKPSWLAPHRARILPPYGNVAVDVALSRPARVVHDGHVRVAEGAVRSRGASSCRRAKRSGLGADGVEVVLLANC